MVGCLFYWWRWGHTIAPSEKFRQRYTTSLFRVLGFAYCPSTDGVAICQPVGLRPLLTDMGTVAPWFVSPGSCHPGLGRSDVAALGSECVCFVAVYGFCP